MAQTTETMKQELTVQRRSAVGKRRVRRARHEGWVPGILYGKGTEPLTVSVNQRELGKTLHSKRGEHALLTLRLSDQEAWETPVLIKSVQHHPVDGRVLHVDFQAIVMTERLRVKVPLVLKGEPIGVKQEGGILEHFLREIEVECLPAEIPASVEFDVSALSIGATIHVRDLTPPGNAKVTSDPAGVVASIQKPKEEKPEETAAALTEPEVIREKKEEEPAAEAAKDDAGEAKKEKEKDTKS